MDQSDTKQDCRRVFVWKDFQEWKPVIESMFKDTLTPEVEEQVKKNQEHIKFSGSPLEFEEFVGKPANTLISDENVFELICQFRQTYSHIRVYHACRTEDVQGYYKNGLLLPSRDRQHERFRSVFMSGKFPEITEDLFQQSIQKLRMDTDICVVLDNRDLRKWAGHFLIYGSEYLGNLALNLKISNEYMPELRKIGKPTMFKVVLPNEYVRDTYIHDILDVMLKEWVYGTAHSKLKSNHINFTIGIYRSVPGEYLISHYFPTRIRDPYESRLYNAGTNEYEEED